MRIQLVCRGDKLPTLKKQLSSRKLMTSFRQALSNVALNSLTMFFDTEKHL